jgi:hypothetical protein
MKLQLLGNICACARCDGEVPLPDAGRHVHVRRETRIANGGKSVAPSADLCPLCATFCLMNRHSALSQS